MSGKGPLSGISGDRISEAQAAARHAAIGSMITGGSTPAEKGRPSAPAPRSAVTGPIGLRILLDMDGVLCDFIGGYFKQYPHLQRPDPWPAGTWSLAEAIGGIAPMEFDQAFWSNLDWMPDGRLILSTLNETVGEENICILSSCDVDQAGLAAAGKLQWIKKNCPQFSKRYLFGPDKRFCAHSNVVLVDDKDENVDNFRADGGRAILIPRRWNTKWYRDDVDMRSYIKGQLDATT